MSEQVRFELERLIREQRVDYSGLSRLLGRNAAYIQQFIKRGSPRELDPKDRRVLAQFFGVEEELLGGPPRTGGVGGLVEIPLLDVRASAGHGAMTELEARHARFGFDEKWLKQLTASRPASLSVIRVEGDSMEPTLSDGDEVMVDLSDTGQRLHAQLAPAFARELRDPDSRSHRATAAPPVRTPWQGRSHRTDRLASVCSALIAISPARAGARTCPAHWREGG